MRDPLADVEMRPVQAVVVPVVTIAAFVAAFVLVPGWRGVLLLILGIVLSIMLHELGHFIAAKRAGMKVTEFFLGFGPRLWSFRKGETEYGVKAVPLGGYVRIVGMSNLEEIDPDDEPRTYRQAKYRDKMAVALAGIAMNVLIFMVCVFVVLVGHGRPGDDPTNQVGFVAENMPAEAAGLKTGEWIVSANGRPVGTFEDVRNIVGGTAGSASELRLTRAGQPVAATVDPKWFYDGSVVLNSSNEVTAVSGDAASAGVHVGDRFEIPAVVLGVVSGARTQSVTFDPTWLRDGTLVLSADNVVQRATGPAAKAGFREGDRLAVVRYASAGTPEEAERRAGSSAAPAQVLRGGQLTERPIVPEIQGERNQAGEYTVAGRVGLSPSWVSEPVGPVEAAKQSVISVGVGTKAVVVALGTIFSPSGIAQHAEAVVGGEPKAAPSSSGSTSASSAEANRPRSVIGIVAVGSSMVNQDIWMFFALMGSLNLFLALFNLLPILPFDGGHVVVATYEKIASRIKGRDVHVDFRKLLPITTAVTAVLIVFGVSVMFRDLRDLFQ